MNRAVWNDGDSLQRDARMPLHQQLKELIQEKITNGLLSPGDLLPPEIELAGFYNVSRTTIRRALTDLVQEGLLYRVPGQGTHVRRRRSPAIRAIALVCPFIHWYMLDLIDGIERVVKAHGYELIVRNTDQHAEVEAQQIEQLLDMSVAGIVLWPKTPDFGLSPSAAISDLLAGAIPAVVVDQYAEDVDTVTTDNFGGAYLLGQYLLDLGHTRIGLLTNHHQLPSTVQDRWDGLQEAVRNYGGTPDSELLFQSWGDESAFQEWLASKRPQALFCANDFIALEAMGVLGRLGISVPSDMAVVGYDDIPLAASMNPSLTTVRQDFRAVGQSAGRLLLQRLSSPGLPPRHIVLPVHLQVRGSCGSRLMVESSAN